MRTQSLPMFPLGTVLFPGALLPLHVFEARYRALVEHCLATPEPEFGTVLIERGSEVGGGDSRFAIGVGARIVQWARLDDGRFTVLAVGTRRLRIRRWVAEDPYPTAAVEWIEEPPSTERDRSRRDELAARYARVVALRGELGAPSPERGIELDSDPRAACFEAAAGAGLGPLDAQRLLEADGPSARLDLIVSLLDEQTELLAARLQGR